jgi:hypothetical protein
MRLPNSPINIRIAFSGVKTQPLKNPFVNLASISSSDSLEDIVIERESVYWTFFFGLTIFSDPDVIVEGESERVFL